MDGEEVGSRPRQRRPTVKTADVNQPSIRDICLENRNGEDLLASSFFSRS